MFKILSVLILLLSIPILQVCNLSKKQQLLKQLSALEAAIKDTSRNTTPASLVKAYAEKAEKFALSYPRDKKAPYYLLQSISTFHMLGNIQRALALSDTFLKLFPNSQYEPEALMLRGIILKDAGKIEEAKSTWKQIFEKYPTHPLAKDAQILYETAYLPPESLIKQTQKPI